MLTLPVLPGEIPVTVHKGRGVSRRSSSWHPAKKNKRMKKLRRSEYALLIYLFISPLSFYIYIFSPLVTRLGVVTRDGAHGSELEPSRRWENSAGEWEDWGSILERSVSPRSPETGRARERDGRDQRMTEGRREEESRAENKGSF